MTTATLTSKGQITLPAAVRSGLGVGTGDRVEFIELTPGRYELVAATLPVTALKGMVTRPSTRVTIADMDAAVRKRAAESLRK
jgi:AbrB family looped-hinge helix DNA binding protein